MRRDIRLRFRQGFHFTTAFVATLLVFGVSQPPGVDSEVDWMVRRPT